VDDAIRVFSGRTFSSEDIELIGWARKTYPKLPRYEFAETVCELLDWNTPTGKAKWHPCLKFLEQLEAEGLIELPPVKVKRPTSGKIKVTAIDFNTEEINGEIESFGAIQLTAVRPGDELKRWRAYVEQYHMLGFKTVFGSRLQYFITSGDLELGCMQFSASSWALEARDNWIGWTESDRKARLNLIINNSRFLIFPWVHIRNLASKALSMAAKQIQEDWLREYCYAPVLLETFVDTAHFKGTCYKAANWTYLGETKGRGRMDKDNAYSLSRKAIFMYPLQDDFKEVLRGEKPFKAVDLDE
jgi:hypothetical protein